MAAFVFLWPAIRNGPPGPICVFMAAVVSLWPAIRNKWHLAEYFLKSGQHLRGRPEAKCFFMAGPVKCFFMAGHKETVSYAEA